MYEKHFGSEKKARKILSQKKKAIEWWDVFLNQRIRTVEVSPMFLSRYQLQKKNKLGILSPMDKIFSAWY